ncbi:hypothetical protein BRADI_5g08029v3 [Brachypodium distachyon]|uniref:Uncharacterized protein n=1 Tax=Brachypodium distachyon TaxID=15368 RepID=A0A2K2CFV5_BRADI|nr:hypothetical protein BRADI_5g08029v3 [Brachypodium distachyon]
MPLTATGISEGDSPEGHGLAGRRGRRLTLAPAAVLPSPGGSRFACLASRVVDEAVSSKLPEPVAGDNAEAASAVSEAELDGRRTMLTNAELHDEFWSFVGFPTRDSMFWEWSDSEAEAEADAGKPAARAHARRSVAHPSAASASTMECWPQVAPSMAGAASAPICFADGPRRFPSSHGQADVQSVVALLVSGAVYPGGGRAVPAAGVGRTLPAVGGGGHFQLPRDRMMSGAVAAASRGAASNQGAAPRPSAPVVLSFSALPPTIFGQGSASGGAGFSFGAGPRSSPGVAPGGVASGLAAQRGRQPPQTLGSCTAPLRHPIEHVTKACPVDVYCVIPEEAMAGNGVALSISPTALVSVSGGAISAEVLEAELRGVFVGASDVDADVLAASVAAGLADDARASATTACSLAMRKGMQATAAGVGAGSVRMQLASAVGAIRKTNACFACFSTCRFDNLTSRCFAYLATSVGGRGGGVRVVCSGYF